MIRIEIMTKGNPKRKRITEARKPTVKFTIDQLLELANS
jgi:hypothetical protein